MRALADKSGQRHAHVALLCCVLRAGTVVTRGPRREAESAVKDAKALDLTYPESPKPGAPRRTSTGNTAASGSSLQSTANDKSKINANPETFGKFEDPFEAACAAHVLVYAVVYYTHIVLFKTVLLRLDCPPAHRSASAPHPHVSSSPLATSSQPQPHETQSAVNPDARLLRRLNSMISPRKKGRCFKFLYGRGTIASPLVHLPQAVRRTNSNHTPWSGCEHARSLTWFTHIPFPSRHGLIFARLQSAYGTKRMMNGGSSIVSAHQMSRVP
ncbi:unnamed protein product [Peniophora sp. CBMAI 1063]|nr:unnamed protein product [Peniophora sp. CBMAI 1063]